MTINPCIFRIRQFLLFNEYKHPPQKYENILDMSASRSMNDTFKYLKGKRRRLREQLPPFLPPFPLTTELQLTTTTRYCRESVRNAPEARDACSNRNALYWREQKNLEKKRPRTGNANSVNNLPVAFPPRCGCARSIVGK